MKKMLMILAVAALIAPASAMADDLNPPPWGSTPGLTTSQGWEFTSDLDPTYLENPYGTPKISTDYGSETWMNSYEGRQGILYFDGYSDYLYFDIGNADTTNPRKEIWLQITYFAHDGFPGMDYYIEGWGGEDTGFAGPGVGPIVVDSTANGDWVYEAFHWYIEPNPVGETITLESSFWEDMYIDQIHIDTICIPEPTALCLLGIGALALIRRRR